MRFFVRRDAYRMYDAKAVYGMHVGQMENLFLKYIEKFPYSDYNALTIRLDFAITGTIQSRRLILLLPLL